MIELMFLKELKFIIQVHEKNVIFLTIGIFLNKRFKFQTYVCNTCYDLLMMFMNPTDIAILKITNVDYSCIVTEISKSEALNLMQTLI